MRYVQFSGDRAVVRVRGSLNLLVVTELNEELDEVLDKGCSDVTFDFNDTDFIDSTGLGLVIRVYRRLGKGHVHAVNLIGEVLASFKGARLLEELR